jgi:hypothetical protein
MGVAKTRQLMDPRIPNWGLFYSWPQPHERFDVWKPKKQWNWKAESSSYKYMLIEDDWSIYAWQQEDAETCRMLVRWFLHSQESVSMGGFSMSHQLIQHDPTSNWPPWWCSKKKHKNCPASCVVLARGMHEVLIEYVLHDDSIVLYICI